MTDLAAAPRARLFTVWGTVLYVEAASGELRHGAIETSPVNAVFAAEAGATDAGRRGWLVHGSDDAGEKIVCLAERCLSLSKIAGDGASAVPTLLELVPLERGLIAFTEGGRFLCAQPDGSLHFQNSWCSTWECFLASEDWCARALAIGEEQTGYRAKSVIDRRGIAKFIIDARLRVKANAASKVTKVLIYGYPAWSHGRLFYDLCKNLHMKGYIVDMINWQVDHASYMDHLISYYDFFISPLDGLRTLVEVYRVPAEKVIGLSQHEMDMQILIDQMGREIFERLAGYAVVSYQLFDASTIFGVPRHPLVVQHGIAFDEFCGKIPDRLLTVGYAGSYSHKTREGLEWKRGEIAEAAAREAGLDFKIAGSTAQQISFHDMPAFYKSVDAILISSVTEGAPLPVKEGAASGRLVISTPVGDFPLRASQGFGIVAPIESHKYKKFVTETLRYYKHNPAAFTDRCRNIQDAARQLDWPKVIGDWVELIETARSQRKLNAARAAVVGRGSATGPEQQSEPSVDDPRLIAEPEAHIVTMLARPSETLAKMAPHDRLRASVLDRLNLEQEFGFLKGKGLGPPTNLCHLMSSFGSDKGGPFHNYTVLYDRLFSRFRNEELAIFELGLGTNKAGAASSMGPEGKPGASLRGWRAYFPRARIYGADIDADILFQEDRIKTFWTDQRKPRAIRALWDKFDGIAFDIIIDDGLHEASANICFFMNSFGKLKPGGIYVIEDIPTNDADLVRSFARCIACASKSIVCGELDHPVNKADNRLLIYQKA